MADDTDERAERQGDQPRVPAEGSPTHPEVDDLLASAELRGASDVLVLGPMRRRQDDRVCRSFLAAGEGPPRDALVVSLTHSADDRLSVLRELGEERPSTVRIVSTAGRRGEGSRATTTAGDGHDTVTVDTVPDPSDLTKLGITVSRAVEGWEGDDPGPVVCFHSLTALLQYVDTQRAFRFVHLLQKRLGAVDAVTHYHMDADAHDAQTVATLRTLFDAVVEVGPDGRATLAG